MEAFCAYIQANKIFLYLIKWFYYGLFQAVSNRCSVITTVFGVAYNFCFFTKSLFASRGNLHADRALLRNVI